MRRRTFLDVLDYKMTEIFKGFILPVIVSLMALAAGFYAIYYFSGSSKIHGMCRVRCAPYLPLRYQSTMDKCVCAADRVLR